MKPRKTSQIEVCSLGFAGNKSVKAASQGSQLCRTRLYRGGRSTLTYVVPFSSADPVKAVDVFFL